MVQMVSKVWWWYQSWARHIQAIQGISAGVSNLRQDRLVHRGSYGERLRNHVDSNLVRQSIGCEHTHRHAQQL